MSPSPDPRNERRNRRFRADEKFHLLGHDCPLGHYPAPVVPIGTMGERLVAVHRLHANPEYPQIVGASYAPVADNAEFVHYSKKLLARLESLDPIRDVLFAESAQVVFAYQSLQALSQVSAVREADPFVRLSIVAGSGDPRETSVELIACVQFILESEPEMADDWYRNMTRELTARGYRFPPTWRELLDIRESPPDLRGWEAISRHLAVSVPTAQLWAEPETLPVHRTRSGEVYCNFGSSMVGWSPLVQRFDGTKSMFSIDA